MRIIWIYNRHAPGGLLPGMLERLTDTEVLIRSGSMEDAPELCTAHAPDLIIIDVCSQDGEELDYIAPVKRDYPNVKVCVVLDATNDVLTKKAESSGADIVAPQNISPDELMLLFKYTQKHYRVFPKPDSERHENL